MNNEFHPTTDHPLIRWLRKEKKNGFAPIVVFCGRQRSGKSLFAFTTAHELYPKTFKFETHVVKDVEEFVKAYDKYDNDVIVLDEASDALYLYDWSSKFQKVFSIINDSQAYKMNTVFIVLPMVHKLGKLHRHDIDAVVEVTRRKAYNDVKQRWEKAVFYKYQKVMKRHNDLAMKPPRVINIVENCGPVPLPPKHILEPYMAIGQSEFKKEIMKKQLNQILGKPKIQKPAPVLLRPSAILRSPVLLNRKTPLPT